MGGTDECRGALRLRLKPLRTTQTSDLAGGFGKSGRWRLPYLASIRFMQRAITAATVVLAVAASVWIFLAVDAGSHSVSDTLYGAVVPIGLVWLGELALLATVRLLAGRTGKSG